MQKGCMFLLEFVDSVIIPQHLFALRPVTMLQEIMNVEQIMDENVGMDLTEENVETVLDEIRPYLVGVPCLLCKALQCQPTSKPPWGHDTSLLSLPCFGPIAIQADCNCCH